MTITFGTNANNDIYLAPDGNIAVLTGLDAVIGACETASKAQLGEMIFLTNKGIPNFQAVWVGTPNYKTFESYLRATLLGVLGVEEVQSISLSVQEKTLKYTATIKTQFGIGVING